MTTKTQYICEVCKAHGTYRRNYDTTLCDNCVTYDYGRSVPAEITNKYLKRRS